MGSLEDLLFRMNRTPIGAFERSEEPEPAGSGFADYQKRLRNRFPGLDEYSNRVARSSEFQTRIRRVIDGDTIETEEGNTVRLTGIDTPETVHPFKAPEPFGQEATDALKEMLPPGTGVNLTEGFEHDDGRGRLLRFVEAEGGNVNKQMIANGLANLTNFDHPQKEAFLDALEQVIIDQIGAFSYQEQLRVQPSLQDMHDDSLAAGLPPILGEDGQAINPVFAEGFEHHRNQRALGALQPTAAEASDIFNQLRREILGEENELQHQLFTSPEDASAVNELSEILPIKAGLQALLGQEITAPVPRVEQERRFQVQPDGSIVDVGSEVTFGGKSEAGTLAQLAQAALGVGRDLDPETENDVERFITRFGESVANIGDAVSKPDLTIQRLAQALKTDLGETLEFFSKEKSDADIFAQGLKRGDLVDPDLELLERMSPSRQAEPGPVQFKKVELGPGEGTRIPFTDIRLDSTDIAEFAGSIGPQVVLAVIGPGGLPAASIASTRVGKTLVRVGFNAVENLGLEGLDPGPDGEIDALNALAIGAAVGGVFDAGGRLANKAATQFLPQSTIQKMVEANPELAGRMLNTLSDQMEVLSRRSAEIAEQFDRDPTSLFDVQDVLVGLGREPDVLANVRKGNRQFKAEIDDSLRFIEAREVDGFSALPLREGAEPTIVGKVPNETIDQIATKTGIEMDEVISDAVLNAAEAASKKVEPSHRVRVYKENLIRSVGHLIEQQDFAGAWHTLHRGQVAKHLGKNEVRAVKEALIEQVEKINPDKARSLRTLEAQVDTVQGNSIVTFGDILDSPAKSIEIRELLRSNDATNAAKFDPEAGYIRNPFSSTTERFLALDPALKAAVQRGVIADAKPYIAQLTRWHNTVRDNLGRLGRQGLPQALELSRGLDTAREFEEEFQGRVIGRFLKASSSLRPMSRYLIEGGSHHLETIRKWASNIGAQKQWMSDQKQVWDAMLNMKSAQDMERFMRDGSPIGVMLDDMFGGVVGIQGDNFFLKIISASGGSEQIAFTMDDVRKAMGVVQIHKGADRADIIDAWSSVIMEQTTNYARRTYNQIAISKIDDMLEAMKSTHSQSDRQFITHLRTALTETGGTHEALNALRTTMAISRLPMVSISNIPQMGHTAMMFRAKNMARALWRMHAPNWAGNPHKGRLRQMALNDGSGADAVLNEQADLMADFARSIPPDLARAAGRPELANTPLKARLAQKYQVLGRKIVGDVYGLKPMERWLRTVAAETGRIHNSNVLLAVQRLISTPEGANSFRIAWEVAEKIQPESPFFANLFKQAGGLSKARVSSLVADLRMLGQWEGADDVMQLSKLTPENLKIHIDNFFNETSVGRTPGVDRGDMPEFVRRAMERSGKFAAEATQFRVGLQDLPLALNAPGTGRELYRSIMQFRTFNYKHFDTVVRRYVLDNAKRGNYIPLLRAVAVAVPFAQLTGGVTLALKNWISGTEVVGGSWVDLAIETAYGKITDEQFERRLKEMKRFDVLAMRSFDNFQAWGGIGTPGEILELATRGPSSSVGLIAGAGPSSLIAAAHQFLQVPIKAIQGDSDAAANAAITGVERVVGNPFGIGKTVSRFAREQAGVGRNREELRPTALERVFSTDTDEEARVIAQDAQLLRKEAQRSRDRVSDLLDDEIKKDELVKDRVPRAQEQQSAAQREADSRRIKEEYIAAVISGDFEGQSAATAQARAARIKIDFKRLRRQYGGGRQ